MKLNTKQLFCADSKDKVKVGDVGYFGDDLASLRFQVSNDRLHTSVVLDIAETDDRNDYAFRNYVNHFRFFYRVEKAVYKNITTVDGLLRLFNTVPSHQRNILKAKDYELFLPILAFNKEKNEVAVVDVTGLVGKEISTTANIVWIEVKNLSKLFTLANGKELEYLDR
jgi:hypothetical protein